jgi:hypothetical protein
MECRICNVEKKNCEFNVDSRKKSGYATFCKKCKKEIDKISYKKRKEKIITQKHQKFEEVKNQYLKIKSELICEKCGESKIYMLDFHHLNKNQKDFNIGSMVWKTTNFDVIKQEIDKCIVLCSNHHREFHYLNKDSGIT